MYYYIQKGRALSAPKPNEKLDNILSHIVSSDSKHVRSIPFSFLIDLLSNTFLRCSWKSLLHVI